MTDRLLTTSTSFLQAYRRIGGLTCVANRGEIPANLQTAAANSLRAESRKYFTFGNADMSELRVIYTGIYVTAANIETAVGNAQTVRAWLEYNGVSIPFTFSAAALGTIASGAAQLVSDPLFPYQFGLTKFPKRMTAYIRDERNVASVGQFMCRNPAIGSGLAGENTAFSDGTSASQGGNTGALVAPTNGSLLNGRDFGPVCIVGRAIGVPDIAVLGIGDSISSGQADTNAPNGSDGLLPAPGGGFRQRALANVNGRAIPNMVMSYSGTGIAQFLSSCAVRQSFFKYFSHADENYGTNDFGSLSRTPAQVINDRAALWAFLKGGDSAIYHVEAIPILPRCNTSTDNFATVLGQTPNTGYAVGGTFRDPVNAAITAALASGAIDGIINVNTVVADPINPDRWVANGTANYQTAEGTHPSAALSALMAPVYAARAATWF